MSTALPSPSPARGASLGTLLRLAWRESRSARRRLALYMSSISLGVAALVAIDSYSGNVTRSVREQSRTLLGGDLAISSRERFAPPVQRLLDSLARAGVPDARQTTFSSMAVVPRTTGTRFAQVRAVSAGYPFYGEITTRPADAWARLQRGAYALVDPSLLVSLNAHVGDSLTLGYGHFLIIGALEDVPGDPGIEAAIGPRVFIPERYVPETALLVTGSRATYQAVLRLPASVDPQALADRLRPRLRAERAQIRTVQETEGNLTNAIEQLRRFLGVVGLVALLLGGIGVASGVHAFVMRKIDTVAVLRCLGATSWQVLAIYAVQAAAMGLLGAAAGALLGIGIQLALPHALGDFLPVNVRVRPEPAAIGAGLLVGVWVSLVFALRPLVALRRVSPLQTLRRETDAEALGQRRFDPLRALVTALVVASVVAIAFARATRAREGVGFTLGVAVTVGVLWASASALAGAARRGLRARWSFAVRQGVANLYRPGNQTRSVMLALGFGVFLISTLFQVGHTLLRRLDVSLGSTRANIVFFDIQEDQAAGVESLVRGAGDTIVQTAPLVPMRIASINGVSVARLAGDSARAEPPAGDEDARQGERAGGGRSGGTRRRAGWALRREYRSTYRDTLVSSERLVAGRWFAPEDSAGLSEVSLERGVADELGVKLGDVVTWNVQGVRVATRVTSLREVNWARFEPNFFAVFPTRAIGRAPQQLVLLARTPAGVAMGQLQRAVVDRFPNVSSIDLSQIQRTIAAVLDKVTVAVRFLALFSVAMGIPVLFSAVAATRRERVREGVLLKTLGATRRQIREVLVAEYALLGALGSLTGVLLSMAGAWALLHWVFEEPYAPALLPALLIVAAMVALVVTIGVLTGRDVFRETPMVALRAEG